MTDQSEANRISEEIVRSIGGSDPFAAAVRATRMPMLITDPQQHDNPIIFVNDAFIKLTGYSRDEIIGRNCRFLQGEMTSKEDVKRIRNAIDNRVPIELDLCNHKKNGQVFWNRLLIAPVFSEDGDLTYFFASQYDVTLERDHLVRLQQDRDSLQAEAELRSLALSRSEERLKFTLKAGRLGSWSLDLDVMRLIASEGCKENYGRKPSDSLTYEELMASVHRDDIDQVRKAVATSIADHSDYYIEYKIVTPNEEIRWVQVRGQTAYHADGTPMSMAGVSQDITDRKRAEEHRDLLARELSHRVKNTLATVQSIARQTLRAASSLDEAQGALEARIQSLAAANDLLTREGSDWASLTEVVIAALHPFGVENDQRFKISGPILRLAPRVALAFSLAIHELATNSVKYGALSKDKGRIFINWHIVQGSNPPRLWFQWQEIGGPHVIRPTRRGFGSRLIERALAQEIGGTAEIDFRPRGAVFTAEAAFSEISKDSPGE